jgi:dihydroorotate dehydrogenase
MMGDNFSFRKRQQSATATHNILVYKSSHTMPQPCLTAGVCWKMLSQGAGVLTINIRSPEYPGLDDVKEEEYATWQDAGWPD